MNNVSINSSRQIDENVLNFVYGYYVKYDRLTELINQELNGLDKKIAESLESWKDDLLPFLVRNQFNEELISILK